MVRLWIIADDYTGALDTGVKLAKRGIRTRVVNELPSVFPEDCEVLVWDTETRHVKPDDAEEKIVDAVRRHREVPVIYKKTDSGLRGNIGAELAALYAASGENSLAFIPAYPEMNRITRGGIHYIDGVPVDESSFGKDPFNPVQYSSVDVIVQEQTGHPVTLCTDGTKPLAKGINIFDCESREQMDALAEELKAQGVRILAGCAGFGECLPAYLGFEESEPKMPKFKEPLLVICGSIHPVAKAQLACAEAAGVFRVTLAPEEVLTENFCETERGREVLERIRRHLANGEPVMVDSIERVKGSTNAAAERIGLEKDQIGRRAARTHASISRAFYRDPACGTIFFIGGDTLQECMWMLNVTEMEPVGEPESGLVAAYVDPAGERRAVLTKSGGFGTEDLLLRVLEHIREQ